jgi:hypothetical protein
MNLDNMKIACAKYIGEYGEETKATSKLEKSFESMPIGIQKKDAYVHMMVQNRQESVKSPETNKEREQWLYALRTDTDQWLSWSAEVATTIFSSFL